MNIPEILSGGSSETSQFTSQWSSGEKPRSDGRDPTADRAQESRVDSPHSDSTGTGDSIPPGIAILIDILAREALRMVIAEQLGLPVRDSITERTARSVKRNEPAIVSRRCYKDQTYFRLPVDCGGGGSTRTRIRPGSTTEK